MNGAEHQPPVPGTTESPVNANDRRRWLAIVVLALLPLVWVWPSVFGDRTFVPWDLAEFPPASLSLPADEVQAISRRANHDVTEVPVWFLPEMELARDELLAGRWPAWNPHARGGSVLHAHGLIGILYPPNWIAMFAADPASRLGLVAWINLALGGLLAFGLLRELGIGVFAAWFGAALFELSAPMATNAFFWMRLASFVWLPGLMWSVLRLANAESLRPGPLAAVAGTLAMAWLGGFPPFATTTSVIAAMFAAWLVVARARERSPRDGAQLAMRLGAGFVLGAMLAMPQVLPSLRFFPESARSTNPTLVELERQSFESYGLLGYLAPDLISHPTAVHDLPYSQSPLALLLNTREESPGKRALPNYNYTEYAVFVGTFGLLLAIAGAIAGRGRHRWFAVGAFALLAGLALFLPGVNLLFHLPVIKNVWPMRWLAPATLLVCWLAALGFERLRDVSGWVPFALGLAATAVTSMLLFEGIFFQMRHSGHASSGGGFASAIAARYACSEQDVLNYVQQGAPEAMDRFEIAFGRMTMEGGRTRRWVLVSTLLLVGVAILRRPRARTWLLRIGAIATLAQLALHGAPIVRGCERDHPIDSPVHAFLRERAGETAANGGFAIVRGSSGPTIPAALPPGELMARGLRDLNFYSHADGRSFQLLMAMLGPDGERVAAKGYLVEALPDRVLEHPLLDLLGVRYVLSLERLARAGARVGPELRGPNGEFFVFERPHPLPRAFTVPALRALPTDAEVVNALADPNLAPRAAALVLAADLPSNATAAAPHDAPPRTIRFATDHPTVVELDVAAGNAPWLVLADTFLPGWSASVDGTAAPIVRANHAQRAVAIPGRACIVRFEYTSPGLVAGSALAGIATLALLWSFVRNARRGRADAAN